VYKFGQDSFPDRLINQSVTQLSMLTQLWESRDHALFSSGTNLGLKILCTNLDKIHFKADSLINLLHLSTLTQHWESGNHASCSYCTNLGSKIWCIFLDKIHLETHYFLLVQIWARKFGVCFWTRFLLRQTL